VKLRPILFVWLAIPTLWGCGSSPNDTIRVGVFAPLSGANMTYGQSCRNGVLMATEEVNAAGGVDGKQLELFVQDDESRAQVARDAVSRLIDRDRVVAVIGGVTSANSMAAAPVCQKARIPMISPAATSPEVTEAGDCIFRVCFADPFQGWVMAIFARRSLKIEDMAILEDRRSEYSQGLASFFRTTFEREGGRIVADENYAAGDDDFSEQIAAINAAGTAAIFMPGYYQEVGLFAKQARAAGLDVQLLGGDGWNSPRALELAEGALQGGFFSDHFTLADPRPEVQEFIGKYEKRFEGAEPDANAALAYDAVGVLVAALRQAGAAGATDPAKIRAALAGVADYPGVTGPITIDKDRNAAKPAEIMQVRGDRFVRVTIIPPQADSVVQPEVGATP
jgi:branched-chain amino acid transport system substrate-binding protein